MCIYEYDEERHMRQEREYFRAKGRAEGIAEGRVKGIAEGRAEGMSEGIVNTLLNVLGLLDTVPSALREKIKAVKDPVLLTRWTLIAARASSIADFEEKIKAQPDSQTDC